jgi:DNA-binding response OmpR family regulator
MVDIRKGLKSSSSLLEVFAAAEGEAIDVAPTHAPHSKRSAPAFSATAPIEPALADRSVLLGIADPGMAAMLVDAVKAEGIRANFFSGIDEAKALIGKNIPSLVIVEQEKPGMDVMSACRAIRQMKHDEIPVVMVAGAEVSNASTDGCVSDWLIKPFTGSYARTKIRAWVLRTECRWVRAAMPADEAQRVCSLHDLNILDTEADERFDRITRLAAALFDVPMAVISLVDADRQWFKSRIGVDFQETPRDDAFCSHVVYNRTLMIVPDALQDVRFAENPLVVNGPRLRFYAGYPLILEDGSCIGTLCLMDTRPRTLAGPDLQRLHDLADMALHEFQSMTAH